MNSQIKSFLEKNSIKYVLHKHLAVYTCEEAEIHTGNIPGISSKNLFLKQRKKENYFLVILPAYKRMEIKKFGELVNVKNLTFANETELKDILGLTPGSVSPFGLLNDINHVVKLYIHKDIWESDIVSFHPNINTESVELNKENFHKLIGLLNKDIIIID